MEQPTATGKPVPIGVSRGWALGIAVAGVVGMGIYPRPFVDAAVAAAKAIVP